MDNFVTILEKARDAEIKQLKQALKKKKETAVDQLKSEVSLLEKELENKKLTQASLKKSQDNYVKIKTEDFAELELQNKIAKDIFNTIIDSELKKTSFIKKWLESNIENINTLDKGVIYTNSDTKKAISKLVKKHEIKLDKNIEQGFLFENDNIEVDATKRAYFDTLFKENKAEIYKILFS